jgi:DNA polymerase III subunit delta'
MNGIAANTLLKTLEEPAGNARFVLSSSAPHALLPTIRSRCQAVPMALPDTAQAVAWLVENGVAEPAAMLAATGGQPQEALEWSRQGIDAALWQRLPSLVAQGHAGGFANWPLTRVVDALQKLCHDLMSVAAGAEPRYFSRAVVQAGVATHALVAWMRALAQVARHAEHPWNATLVVDSLVQQGERAMKTSRTTA